MVWELFIKVAYMNDDLDKLWQHILFDKDNSYPTAFRDGAQGTLRILFEDHVLILNTDNTWEIREYEDITQD